MIEKLIPYIVPFLLALAFTLVLTPIVRVLNRRFGIVDRPGERRLNKRVIPRGGGIAVYVGVVASYSLFVFASDLPPLGAVPAATFWKLIACAGFIMVVGFFDYKWSLPPLVKLL
jgi:UDP-GlcNAc:undecaprenyl-phosphate GlcNAc-1-phosphate transferase